MNTFLERYIKDKRLLKKLNSDKILEVNLENSIKGIEKYLSELNKDYDIGVVQDPYGGELVIEVKIDYKNTEEKWKLLEDICKIVDEYDQEGIILVYIENLKN